MRYILLAFLIAGCTETKPPDNRLAWKPDIDSIYTLSLDIEEWDHFNNDTNRTGKRLELKLQREESNNKWRHMKMVISSLSITQRGINLGSVKNGSVVVLPAGTMITLSTDNPVIGDDPFYQKHYRENLEVLSKLKGDTIRLTMNEQGEIQGISGNREIIDSIASETSIDRRSVHAFLHDHIGTEAIYDIFNQALFFLPAREVKKGDHWVKNTMLVTKAPVKYSHLITVADIRDSKVELSVKTSVSAMLQEEGRQYGEGEMTGKIIVDQSSGMPVEGLLVESFITHTNYYDIIKKRTITIGNGSRYSSL